MQLNSKYSHRRINVMMIQESLQQKAFEMINHGGHVCRKGKTYIGHALRAIHNDMKGTASRSTCLPCF